LAIKYKIGLNKILGTSRDEANKYVAGVWKENKKAEALLKWVSKFHAWRHIQTDRYEELGQWYLAQGCC
jgi:hypothetical protein